VVLRYLHCWEGRSISLAIIFCDPIYSFQSNCFLSQNCNFSFYVYVHLLLIFFGSLEPKDDYLNVSWQSTVVMRCLLCWERRPISLAMIFWDPIYSFQSNCFLSQNYNFSFYVYVHLLHIFFGSLKPKDGLNVSWQSTMVMRCLHC
jgi:hypothetical protein